jgi:hypothetical protein
MLSRTCFFTTPIIIVIFILFKTTHQTLIDNWKFEAVIYFSFFSLCWRTLKSNKIIKKTRSGPGVRDGTVRSRVRSGPVHGSARDGSTRSIFEWKKDRPTVGPDRGRVRSGPRSRSGPGRIGPSSPFQYSTSISPLTRLHLVTYLYTATGIYANLPAPSFIPYFHWPWIWFLISGTLTVVRLYSGNGYGCEFWTDFIVDGRKKN